MSLKGFHLFFITLSVILSALCSIYGFVNYQQQNSIVHLMWGIMSLVVLIGLLYYVVWFMRKTRRMIL
jgi:uncharacterized membrane protein (UPF0136 family)